MIFLKREYISQKRSSGNKNKTYNEKSGINSFFFNWTPIPEVLSKVEYRLHRSNIIEQEDYNSWAFYIGLIF